MIKVMIIVVLLGSLVFTVSSLNGLPLLPNLVKNYDSQNNQAKLEEINALEYGWLMPAFAMLCRDCGNATPEEESDYSPTPLVPEIKIPFGGEQNAVPGQLRA